MKHETVSRLVETAVAVGIGEIEIKKSGTPADWIFAESGGSSCWYQSSRLDNASRQNPA